MLSKLLSLLFLTNTTKVLSSSNACQVLNPKGILNFIAYSTAVGLAVWWGADPESLQDKPQRHTRKTFIEKLSRNIFPIREARAQICQQPANSGSKAWQGANENLALLDRSNCGACAHQIDVKRDCIDMFMAWICIYQRSVEICKLWQLTLLQ